MTHWLTHDFKGIFLSYDVLRTEVLLPWYTVLGGYSYRQRPALGAIDVMKWTWRPQKSDRTEGKSESSVFDVSQRVLVARPVHSLSLTLCLGFQMFEGRVQKWKGVCCRHALCAYFLSISRALSFALLSHYVNSKSSRVWESGCGRLHSEGGLAGGKRVLLSRGGVGEDDDDLIPEVNSLGSWLLLLVVLMLMLMMIMIIGLLIIALRRGRRGGGGGWRERYVIIEIAVIAIKHLRRKICCASSRSSCGCRLRLRHGHDSGAGHQLLDEAGQILGPGDNRAGLLPVAVVRPSWAAAAASCRSVIVVGTVLDLNRIGDNNLAWGNLADWSLCWDLRRLENLDTVKLTIKVVASLPIHLVEVIVSLTGAKKLTKSKAQ